MIKLRIPLIGTFMCERGFRYKYPVAHSPISWPWWKLFVLSPVRTDYPPPNLTVIYWSFNVWLYTRGTATVWWICLKRRGK